MTDFETDLRVRAKAIAAEANECCNRSDGYEEAIEDLALQHLAYVGAEIERLTAEVERLRAALQFIATYEGSLDRDAYIRLRNHADDVLRDNQQTARNDPAGCCKRLPMDECGKIATGECERD